MAFHTKSSATTLSSQHSTSTRLLDDAVQNNFGSVRPTPTSYTSNSTDVKHKRNSQESLLNPTGFSNVKLVHNDDSSVEETIDSHANDMNDSSPGPGVYLVDSRAVTVTKFKSSPMYSMAKRFKEPPIYQSPGPVYYLSVYRTGKERAPAFTFGARHSMYRCYLSSNKRK